MFERHTLEIYSEPCQIFKIELFCFLNPLLFLMCMANAKLVSDNTSLRLLLPYTFQKQPTVVLPEAYNFFKKRDSNKGVFSSELYEISNNTFFTEHLWTPLYLPLWKLKIKVPVLLTITSPSSRNGLLIRKCFLI